MVNNKETKKNRYIYPNGFSLAEALMTLLIISIITIASIPVITKKKRNYDDTPHGEWTCEYNEQGMHSSWSQDSPTPVVNSSYCEFVPPAKAKSFIVKAVGGGGGGGAGFSELRLDAMYPGETKTIDFLANNKYDIVMVGGGGGGGGGNDERGGTRGYGGGSGAAVSFTFTPSYDISYTIKVGEGGSGGNGDNGKHSAGSGTAGGDTTFGGIVIAGGGTGGEGVRYNRAPYGCKRVKLTLGGKCFQYMLGGIPIDQIPSECVINTELGCAGKYAYSDPTGNLKITNVKSKNGKDGTQQTQGSTTSYYSSIIGEKMMQPTYSYPWPSRGTSQNLASMKAGSIGMGGYGGQGKSASGNSGIGGYAAVKSDILVAGSAGQAAAPVIYPSAMIKNKIRVYLGKGGRGGRVTSSTTATNPSDGTSTVVGDILTAPFGRAGENKAIYPSSSTVSYVKGEDGGVSGFATDETPSFGGRSGGTSDSNSNARAATAFGGGGGGGGALRASQYGTATYNTVYSGNGADGAPGKVIIKW